MWKTRIFETTVTYIFYFIINPLQFLMVLVPLVCNIAWCRCTQNLFAQVKTFQTGLKSKNLTRKFSSFDCDYITLINRSIFHNQFPIFPKCSKNYLTQLSCVSHLLVTPSSSIAMKTSMESAIAPELSQSNFQFPYRKIWNEIFGIWYGATTPKLDLPWRVCDLYTIETGGVKFGCMELEDAMRLVD